MDERNALAELAEFLKKEASPSSEEFKAKAIAKFGVESWKRHEERKHKFLRASQIIAELAKVIDCKEPERIMPLDKPYDDIVLYAPYDNGMTESNSVDEDEKRFIFDLANAAWECREIAEKGPSND